MSRELLQESLAPGDQHCLIRTHSRLTTVNSYTPRQQLPDRPLAGYPATLVCVRVMRGATRVAVTAPAVAFDRFYRYDDLTAILQQYAATYPALATLASIGKSYEGRDIWCL